jgi:hypothetical protein
MLIYTEIFIKYVSNKNKELISRGAILLLKYKNIIVRVRGELKHEQLFCLNVVLMSL